MKTSKLTFRAFGLAALTTAALMAGAAPLHAQKIPRLEKVWEIDIGFNRPESVIFDEARGELYVSNIVGDPSARDGEGYLSRVSPDGELIEVRWIDGLDAPKGLAQRGDRLFVSDVDRLVEIDVPSGTLSGSYPGEGAAFLNDVAVDASGRVYVSDSRGLSGIYRLADGMLHRWLQDDAVASPNGLFAAADRLIVAAGQADDENPGMSRKLKAVSYDDGASIVALPNVVAMGALDAIEESEYGGYFLTDWAEGTVSYFSPDGEVLVLEEIEQGTADLTYVADLQMVFLPLMMSNRLVAYRVFWEE